MFCAAGAARPAISGYGGTACVVRIPHKRNYPMHDSLFAQKPMKPGLALLLVACATANGAST
jgi:hypothetical protein